MKEFGMWLQGELNSRGLTPTKFAQSIGVSHASVSRWLSGERRPKRVHAYKISQALGVSPDMVSKWYHQILTSTRKVCYV